jgi:hypothetical protein
VLVPLLKLRVTSVAAGGPALPCWMAVCTGWSCVFVGRRFLVQWWTTALEHGSADITASRHFWTAGGHVSTPKLDVWTALHVRQTFVLGEKGNELGW